MPTRSFTIIALNCCLILSTAAETEPEADAANETLRIRVVQVAGDFVDHALESEPDPFQLLSGSWQKPKSVWGLVGAIDHIAEDDQFDGLLLSLSRPQLRMHQSQAAEVERALDRYRASGKPLIAWLRDAGPTHFRLAASADHLLLAEAAMIDLPSPVLSSLHLRRAMDLFGVEIDTVRAGRFKGAVEPFTRHELSDELRSHYQTVLRSLNEDSVARLAERRDVTVDTVRNWQAKRLFTADQALASGLVDDLVDGTNPRTAIAKHLEQAIELVFPDQRERRISSPFELFSIFFGGSGRQRSSGDAIAMLHLRGMIVNSDEQRSDQISDSPTISTIRHLADDDRIKAIVVRIASGGGSASASEYIRQELAACAEQKPVLFSLGSAAASGGYWITCLPETTVFAEAETITGSIGVFGLKISFAPLLARMGLHVDHVSLDPSATALSLARRWTTEERDSIQQLIDTVYIDFLERVSQARGLERSAVEAIAQGAIWTGSQALSHGLVDRIGGMHQAVAAARAAASLDDNAPVEHYPEPINPFLQFLQSSVADENGDSTFTSAAIWIRRLGGDPSQWLALLRQANRPAPPTLWAWWPEQFLHGSSTWR